MMNHTMHAWALNRTTFKSKSLKAFPKKYDDEHLQIALPSGTEERAMKESSPKTGLIL